MKAVSIKDLSLYGCYHITDPVVGENGYCNYVIILGKSDEYITVCSPLNHEDVYKVSAACIFSEIEDFGIETNTALQTSLEEIFYKHDPLGIVTP